MRTFDEVYRSVAETVQVRVAEEGLDARLEPPEVSEDCLMSASVTRLLSIEDDSAFVDGLYFKLLDRVPTQRGRRRSMKRLTQPGGRTAEFRRIMESKEYKDRNITVSFDD